MVLQQVTVHKVISVIKHLNNGSSWGIDGLKIRPLKHVVDVIEPTHRDMFHSCLEAAVFPSQMQVARITVFYKKGDINYLGNYKPVSILQIFSKAFDQIFTPRDSRDLLISVACVHNTDSVFVRTNQAN